MMTDKERRVPVVRFKGFDEDWEMKKFGEVSDVRDGTHDSPKYHAKGFPLITSKNLTDQGLDFKNISFISEHDYININKRSKVDISDILFGMIGTIGNPVMVERNDFAIKNVALIKSKGLLTSKFLIQHLKSNLFNLYISNENVGNTQKFLSLSRIRDYNLFMPNLDEQTAIGNFFRTLDDTITLHQRKLDSLKELKKGYLQQMFPQAGENVPRVRFEGFTKPWEQYRLNELVTPIIREVDKPNDPYWRLSVRSHAKGTFKQYVDDPTKIAMDKLYVIKENDLVVNITFAWEHAIAIATKEDDGLFVSHRFPTFLIDKSNKDFLLCIISSERFRKKLELISPGGAGRNRVLNKNDFMLLLEIVPSSDEQTAVGNFFRNLDEQITAQQSKLNLLKQLKAGYLQKMFV